MNLIPARRPRWLRPLMLPLVLAAASCATAPPSATSQHHDPTAYRVDRPQQLPTTLKLRLEQLSGHLAINARVNGQSVGPFLFDTGSNVNGIDMGIAGQLNLPPIGKGRLVGVGGHQAFIARKIDSLTLDGKIALPVHRMVGLNLLAFNRATDFNAAGIIGYTALAGVPFTVDAGFPRLTLYRPASFHPPQGATRDHLWRFRGLPTIAGQVAGHIVLLIIDTGADKALYLPSACLRRWPDALGVPQTGPGQSTGIGGSVGGRQAWVKSLRIFNLNLHNVPTVFEDGPALHVGQHLVGRIGNRLLRHLRLTFSADRRTIWAQWRPGD